MSKMSENRKTLLRRSENYKNTKEKLGKIFHILTTLKLEKPLEYVFHPSHEIFVTNCREFYDKLQETEKVTEVLRELKGNVTYDNDRLKSMSKMLAYLGLVESLGMTLTDMALIFLISIGKDVHITRGRTKHVTSFKELGKVDLQHKLELLKDEKLDIFNHFINRDVRNHIAHLKFRIGNNGAITKPDGTPISIDKEISGFWNGVDTLKLVFEDIGFQRWLGEKVNSERKEGIGAGLC